MKVRASPRGVVAEAAGLAALAILLLVATARGRRLTRHLARRAGGNARHLAGRGRGIRHRLLHGGPPEDVSDAVLAQRIRSSLGLLEKRLDLPHLHVSVCNRNVVLHGVAATPGQAQQLENAVRGVPGVQGVESRLQLGLTPADTRPSEGRVPAASDMRLELQAAARGLGLGLEHVATVLTVFLHRIPAGERDHVLAHLPADVRALIAARAPARVGRITDEASLRAAVVDNGPILEQRADDLIRAVLGVLRERVPEETTDVSAVLPTGLKQLWAHPPRTSVP